MKTFLITLSNLFFLAVAGYCQLSGNYYIPSGSPGYATLAAAIADLNSVGVQSGGGPVIFNIAVGYTETFPSPSSGIITASGNENDPIIFRKEGTGSNPLITAGTGVSSTTDGIIVIAGGDYITFEGIDLSENPLNLNATTQTEWGYALVKANSAAPFNGCQYVTIKNCSIALTKTNVNSVGIYAGNHTAGSTSSLTISSASDAMNNCKVFGNYITNVYRGMTFTGFTALNDANIEIGVDGGNIVTDFGGAAGGTGITPQAYGIYTLYQSNIKVANNTVNGGSGTIPYLYGIRTSNGTNGDVYNNTVTLNGGANNTVYGIGSELGATGSTVNIHHNKIENCSLATATTGLFYGIQNQTSGSVNFNLNIYENEIKNNFLAGTGNLLGIDGGVCGTLDLYNNMVYNNSKNNSGQIVMIKTGNESVKYQIHGNIMYSNHIITVGTVSAASTINGFNCLGSNAEYFYNNQIYDCSIGGTTTGSSTIYGINAYSLSSTLKSFYGNTIYNLAINSGSGPIYGIYFGNVNAGTSYTLNNNEIYNLSAAGTSGAVTGIHIAGGNGLHIFNNFISDLKAPDAMGAIAINGINIAGGSLVNAYYNTIFLNASSTASTFGSSGIYKSATVNSDFRNNCVVNVSVPGTSGKTVAFRWSSTYNASYYSSLSNNNDWYAGSPSPSNLIFFDGTNADETLASFQTRVNPREMFSVTEYPPFVNTYSAPYDLHIQLNVPTYCESTGTPVSAPVSITADFDYNTRSSIPDIGADEFSGTPNFTCSSPNPGNTLTTLNSLCVGQSITLSTENLPTGIGNVFQWQYSVNGIDYVNIPDAISVTYTTTPVIPAYYRCGVTCLDGPSTTCSNPVYIIFSNSLTSVTPGNRCGPGTVDLAATSASTVNWYSTPSGPGYLATGQNWTTPVINSTTSYYAAPETVAAGSVTVGAGATTSNNFPNPFYSSRSNIHAQYLITANELFAAGLAAGNITSVALNVTSAGTLPMKDLSVKIAMTNAANVSSFLAESFVTVYTNASYMPIVGLNVLTFSAPFYWDGISNIVLEFCHGNSVSSSSMSRTVRSDATSYVSSIKTHSNTAISGSAICTDITSNLATYSSRPQFTFDGQRITCAGPRSEVVATVNSIPAQPGNITGETNPLEGSSQNYSVVNEPGISYAWNFPSGWIQTGGGTTNAATVTVGSGSGDIVVTPSNGCGTGTARTLAVVPVTAGKTLNLKVYLEGLYAGAGVMNKAQDESGDKFTGDTADMVTVELHNVTTYSTVEYSSGLVELGTDGNISITTIPAGLNGSYYITVIHRNSIETTTSAPVSFAGSTINYDFTTGAAQAYGDNQKDAGGGYYAIWGGDVSQDGIVDSGDMNPVDNAATAITFGYVQEDVNGDGLVDSGDMNIVDNNATAIIMAQLP